MRFPNPLLLLGAVAVLAVTAAADGDQPSSTPPTPPPPPFGAAPALAPAAGAAPRRVHPDFEKLEALRMGRDEAQNRALELSRKADERRRAIVEANPEAKALSDKAAALASELDATTNALEALFAADGDLSALADGAAKAREEAMDGQRRLQEEVARAMRARQRRPAPPRAAAGGAEPGSAESGVVDATLPLPPDLKPHPRARPFRRTPVVGQGAPEPPPSPEETSSPEAPEKP